MKECIKISYLRSILQQKTAGGGNMLVIGLPMDKLEELVSSEMKELLNKLEIACENDNKSIVLAGKSNDIKTFNTYLKEQNIFNVIIRGRCAFHSSLQDIIKEEVLEGTKNIKINEPNIKLISTATNDYITKDNYTLDYWWKNIRQKVSLFKH